jgi:uncharacterized protein
LTGIVVLPAFARRPRPWKNGGGLTYDVAAYPPGGDLDSFDWRVSIAHVEKDGPFSVFAGVTRTLALLEGDLELKFDADDAAVSLAPFSDPLAFPCDGLASQRRATARAAKYRNCSWPPIART